MQLGAKDRLILLQNLTNRATELAIAKYGKDVTVAQVDAILTELANVIGRRISKIED